MVSALFDDRLIACWHADLDLDLPNRSDFRFEWWAHLQRVCSQLQSGPTLPVRGAGSGVSNYDLLGTHWDVESSASRLEVLSWARKRRIMRCWERGLLKSSEEGAKRCTPASFSCYLWDMPPSQPSNALHAREALTEAWQLQVQEQSWQWVTWHLLCHCHFALPCVPDSMQDSMTQIYMLRCRRRVCRSACLLVK